MYLIYDVCVFKDDGLNEEEKARLERKIKRKLKKKQKKKMQKKLKKQNDDGKGKGDKDSKFGADHVELDERKRGYNSMYDVKAPTEEEMEDYYKKRKQFDDPMAHL
jgi:pre-mRNA-processing factor SLU7